jgi:hypothetical protein
MIHERASLLCYTYIAPLVGFYFIVTINTKLFLFFSLPIFKRAYLSFDAWNYSRIVSWFSTPYIGKKVI